MLWRDILSLDAIHEKSEDIYDPKENTRQSVIYLFKVLSGFSFSNLINQSNTEF